MDSSSFEVPGFVLDPSKCSKLSIAEKRELVYELSKWANGAPELLHSWSRQEILQILCAEIGKERKYTGLTKLKIIENLLKVVSEKKLQDHGSVADLEPQPSAATGQRTAKRQRKTDHPNRLPVAANSLSISPVSNGLGDPVFCENSACRAKLSRENAFCKRCSCCICYQYDDNKDPSLWLTCISEPPFQGESCGMSCHLECALRHEKSGIAKDEQDLGLDGSFYCLSCGKVNDLIGCWRKQMITARDTRRVDILCYRVSLSQKLLTGTKHYQKLSGIVAEAMKKLEADVGPLSGLPVKKARGIVNRLSSGPEVQRLCSSAIESLDLMPSGTGFSLSSVPVVQDSSLVAPRIRFEDVCTSSVTVIVSYENPSLGKVSGYTLWHRKADEADYPTEPTCTLFEPNTRFSLSGLTPAAVYLFKVVYFDNNKKLRTCEVQMQTCSDGVPKFKGLEEERSRSPAANCSSLSNPSSVEDESNNVISCTNERESEKNVYEPYCKTADNNNSKDVFTEGLNCIATDQRGPQKDLGSMLDEEHAIDNSMPTSVNLKDKHSPEGRTTEEASPENGSNTPVQSGMECVPFVHISEAGLPNTPFKLENFKDGLVRSIRPKHNKDLDNGSGSSGKEEEPQDGSSVKKRSAERRGDKCSEHGDKDFGYYVKVIRWLECNGHIKTSFRQKFLTWYSLRATPEEVRVVKVFVDTLIEDPSSLAGQLIDTFSEVISSKRSSVVPTGFCLKLWH